MRPCSVRRIDRRRPAAALAAPFALGAAAAATWAGLHATSAGARQWRAPLGAHRSAGPLSVRFSGAPGGRPVVLLHGLVASSDYFGRSYEEVLAHDCLIVPDLAGFGRSREVRLPSFGLDEHCAALGSALTELGVLDRAITVGGHSMGATVAARWAAQNPDQVRRLVLWSPLAQRSPAATQDAIARLGLLERLFVLDTTWAERACHWVCEHRRLAAAIAVASNPRLPPAIARRGVEHTWPSYAGTLRDVVLGHSLEDSLATLFDAGVPVTITVGARDSLSDHGYLNELVARFPACQVVIVPGSHHIPLEQPASCASQLDAL